MPPNLLLKAAFVRGDLESVDKSSLEEKDSIRTDFILQNAYSYVLKNKFEFDAMGSRNAKEEVVLKELQETIDAFRYSYGEKVKGLCSEVDITQDTISSVVLGVSNELFCEGITWSRIIALFVFVRELTLQCLSKKYPDTVVDQIYECFCRLVKEKLKGWIDDHGGWEGLTTLSVTQGNFTAPTQSKSNPGWAKGLLYNTVRVIGTLAHLANSTSHPIP